MIRVVIKQNILAINSHRHMNTVKASSFKASARLSSGLRINSAADDAAGLAISQKMRAQIMGLIQAERNVEYGINLIQTMEGAMSEVSSMLIRKRELIIQALNDTNTEEDRQKIQDEINQLKGEIDSLADRAQYNRISLLNISGDRKAISALISAKVPKAPLTGHLWFAEGTHNIVGRSDYIDAITGEERIVVDGIVDTGTLAYPNQVLTDVGSFTAEEGDSFIIRVTFFHDNPYHPAAQIWPTLIITAPCGTTFGRFGGILTGGDFFGGSANWQPGTVYSPNDLCESVRFVGRTPNNVEEYVITNVFAPGAGSWNITVINGMISPYNPFQVEIIRLTGDRYIPTPQPPGPTQPSTPPASQNNDLWIQTGPNANQGMSITRFDIRTKTLGINQLDVSTTETGTAALIALDDAFGKINSFRAIAGAQQNRLEAVGRSLRVSAENLMAAKSRIKDADMAKEKMRLTRANILQQAATAMLAQAHQVPEMVLRLLR